MPWLATAYVAGPSLTEAVRGHGPLPVRSTLALTAGLAEGLSAIHAAGVVHRDLKPSNVLLAEDGPRVIDFGISEAAEASVVAGANVLIGSPGYMSPEQVLGADIGPASDMFSLGSVLTFAATGPGPFGAGSNAALMYRLVNSPADLGDVPGELRPLVGSCLAKHPGDRPTARELLAEVGALQPAPGWLAESIMNSFIQDSPRRPPRTWPARASRSRRPRPPPSRRAPPSRHVRVSRSAGARAVPGGTGSPGRWPRRASPAGWWRARPWPPSPCSAPTTPRRPAICSRRPAWPRRRTRPYRRRPLRRPARARRPPLRRPRPRLAGHVPQPVGLVRILRHVPAADADRFPVVRAADQGAALVGSAVLDPAVVYARRRRRRRRRPRRRRPRRPSSLRRPRPRRPRPRRPRPLRRRRRRRQLRRRQRRRRQIRLPRSR